MQRSHNRGLTSRMACRLGRLASLTLLASIMMILLAGVPPTAAAPGTYTEDFMTTAYQDADATNATGWGTGPVRLPRKSPTLVGACDTPGEAWDVWSDGRTAYVADANSGMQILNVTNPRNPTLLGTYDTPGIAYGVAVAGSIAYVADYGAGLQVINVTDPRSPALLGSYDTLGWAQGVWTDGRIAYLATGTWGLQILDVTNPRSPALLYGGSSGYNAWGVWVAGSIAYVACGDAGLRIFNVTNPINPTALGTYNTPGTALSVHVQGAIAYVADMAPGLQIINVTNPRQPLLLGAYDPGEARDVWSDGRIAYVAGTYSGGLQVLNVTNPHQLTLLDAYDTPGTALGVAVAGNVAYVADYLAGLQVLYIADLTQPSLVGSYGGVRDSMGVVVAGGIAYLADFYGFMILNVTNPRSPTLLGSYDTPGDPKGVAVAGGLAYLADSNAGLEIFNVTNPRQPTLLSTYSFISKQIYDLAVVDGIAYLAISYNPGLEVVNVTNPRQPAFLGWCSAQALPYALAVAGGIAYVADYTAGLTVINVTNPRSPAFLVGYDTPDCTWGVTVVAGTAYVADGSAGLHLLNVTNPRQPTLLSTYDTPGNAHQVTIVGGIAYVADDPAGVQVLNVTNPRQPTLLGTCDTPWRAFEVAVVGDYGYVADAAAGLQVLEVQRNRCRQFEGCALAQSLVVVTLSAATFIRATLISTQTTPSDTTIAYSLSPDDGTHWEPVTPGVTHVFTNVGAELRWRAILTTSDSVQTPVLTSLIITYSTRLEAPTLVAPADGSSTNDNTPTFQWTPVAGVVAYLVQLDTAASFNSPSLRNVTVRGGTTTYTLDSPLADGTWFWRVAANDSSGDLGFFSSPWQLHIDAAAPTWDQPLTDQAIEFPSGFQYDVNASDVSGIASYWVNDTTHFTITVIGGIRNVTALPVGVYWLEVRAYDPYTNYCTASFAVTVQDTTAPTWDQPPTSQVVEFPNSIRYDINASDASGVDYYWLNDTTHFAIDSNGVITNTMGLAVGVYGLEVRAYDPYTNHRSATFTVAVQDTTAPTWDEPPQDQLLEYGQLFRYDVNASDASGIVYYWLSDTTHFTVDAAGVITNTTTLTVDVYSLDVRAYDAYAHYCTATFTVTVRDTTSPTWDQLPANQAVEFDTWFRYDVNASDLSGIDHYWVNSSALTVNPSGLITNVTRLAVGFYWIEVRAYDFHSHYCTATFTLTVQDTQPPTWVVTPTDQAVEAGTTFAYDANATDPSGIDLWWLSDTTHFTILSTGLITNVVPLTVGDYWVEARAYDPYAHYCFAVFCVTVQDTTPPSWLVDPSDRVLSLGQPLDYQLEATDYSGIARWSINDTTHFSISGTGRVTNITLLAVGRYGINVTIHDPYNNGRNATFTVTVEAETTTTTTTPPIPGFPIVAIALGLVTALSLLVTVRWHRRKP